MGMNSGIHDAVNLGEKLSRVLSGEADDELLDRYTRQRRHAAVSHVQAISIRNKKLMAVSDPTARAQRHDELRRAAGDERLAREFLLSARSYRASEKLPRCRSDVPSLKEQMRSGQAILGLILRAIRSPEIGRIAKASGHDFLFIDTQHSVFDLETIQSIAFAAKASDVATLVRVTGARRSQHRSAARQWSDGHRRARRRVCGRSHKRRARGKVRTDRPPLGGRRRCLPRSLRRLPWPRPRRILNDQTVVVCMIESKIGLANVGEIAAVEGVDVLHVGCNDLLMDLGKPGEFGCDEINEALSTVIDACDGQGKFVGFGGDRDPHRQAAMIHAGARFVTTESDVNYLLAAARAKTTELRALIGDDP